MTIEGPNEEMNFFKKMCKDSKLSHREGILLFADMWQGMTGIERRQARFKLRKRIQSGITEPKVVEKPFRIVAWNKDVAAFDNPLLIYVWAENELKKFLLGTEPRDSIFRNSTWIRDFKKLLKERIDNNLYQKE